MSNKAEVYCYSEQSALELLLHIRSVNVISKGSKYDDIDFYYTMDDGSKVYEDTYRYFEDRFRVVIMLVNGLHFNFDVLRSFDETDLYRHLSIKSSQAALPCHMGFLSMLETVMDDGHEGTFSPSDVLGLINDRQDNDVRMVCLSLSYEAVLPELVHSESGTVLFDGGLNTAF